MLWKGRRQSDNVVDQRGVSGGTLAAGGGVGALLLAVVIYFLGGDPSVVLNNAGRATPASQRNVPQSQEGQAAKEFVGVVLADTEDVWTKLMKERGKNYQQPKLVLFTGQIQSACGFASSAVGPFYCPEDQNVYIDLGFYDELKTRFGATGDFAQAYVIAHEVGHHIQNQLGIMDKVTSMRRRVSKSEFNQLQVRLELQADYFAGVWAHHAQKMKNILDKKDIDDALKAASSIGDDRIQMQSQGYVVPESFTHGTSEQRARWFKRGWESGDIRQGNTFDASNL